LKKLKRLYIEDYSLLTNDEICLNAFHYAVNLGFENIVQFLVNQEPSLMDMRECSKGRTTLHIAVKNREQKICYILAAAGCSI